MGIGEVGDEGNKLILDAKIQLPVVGSAPQLRCCSR
jgi:hypothetical protein